jgi:2-keto-4-pentenoate hydratase/2-oxohepta-3-ene-1,7-dioic acid hydratase in catechol pathway
MERVYRVVVEECVRHVVERDGRCFLVEGRFPEAWERGREVAVSLDRPLAPLVPGKIVGIGRNYREHAAEQGKPVPTEPLMFLKPPSAVVGPGEPIVLPDGVGRVDYEAEIGVVIGRRASKVRREEAMACVCGLTCVNDVTARALQARGVQFSQAKGYDTFSPIGPCVLLETAVEGRIVEGLLNGDTRQHGRAEDLIFPVDVLIEYVSHVMTLEPGDVIATGTPAGIGPLAAGDVFTVRVSGIGDLVNPVVA